MSFWKKMFGSGGSSGGSQYDARSDTSSYAGRGGDLQYEGTGGNWRSSPPMRTDEEEKPRYYDDSSDDEDDGDKNQNNRNWGSNTNNNWSGNRHNDDDRYGNRSNSSNGNNSYNYNYNDDDDDPYGNGASNGRAGSGYGDGGGIVVAGGPPFRNGRAPPQQDGSGTTPTYNITTGAVNIYGTPPPGSSPPNIDGADGANGEGRRAGGFFRPAFQAFGGYMDRRFGLDGD
ncbi:hypothetical protein GUJ93_ZPchr0001g29291 [Zizania palustris]|uniref:Uncharacterized protein n=1 Tax=Zizania palustris TaxID=103762 RepID=A0A8J5SF28_ZIZPA|nr:hypothetical protein GUJ93_ZPchr0001g29291 [Zizania palustris]